MKAARFVATARDEFLAAVLHYNNQEPGLGTRFAAEVGLLSHMRNAVDAHALEAGGRVDRRGAK